jgi:hypothetical protein
MWISSDSLLGAMHTMLGRLAMKVTSKAPQWVAPSAPTRPARSMAKRTAWGRAAHNTGRDHCRDEVDVVSFLHYMVCRTAPTLLLCIMITADERLTLPTFSDKLAAA